MFLVQGFESHFCHCFSVNQSETYLAETVAKSPVETARDIDSVHIPPPNVTTDDTQSPTPSAQRAVTVSVERLSVISSASTVSVTSLAEGSKDKKDQYDSFNPFDDKSSFRKLKKRPGSNHKPAQSAVRLIEIGN